MDHDHATYRITLALASFYQRLDLGCFSFPAFLFHSIDVSHQGIQAAFGHHVELVGRWKSERSHRLRSFADFCLDYFHGRRPLAGQLFELTAGVVALR